MRIVGPALLAVCFLLCGAKPATAAGKIRIEIVEATTKIVSMAHTSPGSPEQIRTHCDTRVDVNCTSIVIPATDPVAGTVPLFLFSVKAILPDGSHVELTCLPSDKKCKGVTATSSDESMTKCVMAAIASDAAAPARVGNTSTCTTKNLGFFEAKRDKNDVVLYTPNGKLRYQITGSW